MNGHCSVPHSSSSSTSTRLIPSNNPAHNKMPLSSCVSSKVTIMSLFCFHLRHHCHKLFIPFQVILSQQYAFTSIFLHPFSPICICILSLLYSRRQTYGLVLRSHSLLTASIFTFLSDGLQPVLHSRSTSNSASAPLIAARIHDGGQSIDN